MFIYGQNFTIYSHSFFIPQQERMGSFFVEVSQTLFFIGVTVCAQIFEMSCRS